MTTPPNHNTADIDPRFAVAHYEHDLIHAKPAADQSGADERKLFEQWHAAQFPYSTMHYTRNDDGSYVDQLTEDDWQRYHRGVIARARRIASTQPAPEKGDVLTDEERTSIWNAISATEYKYFGMYEFDDEQHKAVDTLVSAAQKLIALATPQPFPAPAVQSGELPDAWLFICKKPGKSTVYASVEENDTNHWPIDQWSSVEKRPLYARQAIAQTAPVVAGEADMVDLQDELWRAYAEKVLSDLRQVSKDDLNGPFADGFDCAVDEMEQRLFAAPSQGAKQ